MIKKLHYDDDGNLMMSSFNGGMQIFDRKTNIFVDFAAGTEYPPFMSVYDFVKDGESGYWISDPDSPLRYLDLKSKKVYVRRPLSDGIPLRARIENMYRDEEGCLCLVTSKGLYKLDHDGMVSKHYAVEDASFAKNVGTTAYSIIFAIAYIFAISFTNKCEV